MQNTLSALTAELLLVQLRPLHPWFLHLWAHRKHFGETYRLEAAMGPLEYGVRPPEAGVGPKGQRRASKAPDGAPEADVGPQRQMRDAQR